MCPLERLDITYNINGKMLFTYFDSVFQGLKNNLLTYVSFIDDDTY